MEEKKLDPQLENYSWLIKPCEFYADEYSDCCSFKARFNQYFIHGKMIDCSQWKVDADNCYKWEKHKDVKAAKELIKSEQQKREVRLRAHYDNDIWEKRKSPPEDWNKPLPDYLLKEYETSYLYVKSKELKGEYTGISDESFCSIM